METKRVLDNLRMPKQQEIFTTVATKRDSLFFKTFSTFFCFEQVKTLKNFSKKLCTSKIKKKRRSEDKK